MLKLYAPVFATYQGGVDFSMLVKTFLGIPDKEDLPFKFNVTPKGHSLQAFAANMESRKAYDMKMVIDGAATSPNLNVEVVTLNDAKRLKTALNVDTFGIDSIEREYRRDPELKFYSTNPSRRFLNYWMSVRTATILENKGNSNVKDMIYEGWIVVGKPIKVVRRPIVFSRIPVLDGVNVVDSAMEDLMHVATYNNDLITRLDGILTHVGDFIKISLPEARTLVTYFASEKEERQMQLVRSVETVYSWDAAKTRLRNRRKVALATRQALMQKFVAELSTGVMRTGIRPINKLKATAQSYKVNTTFRGLFKELNLEVRPDSTAALGGMKLIFPVHVTDVLVRIKNTPGEYKQVGNYVFKAIPVHLIRDMAHGSNTILHKPWGLLNYLTALSEAVISSGKPVKLVFDDMYGSFVIFRNIDARSTVHTLYGDPEYLEQAAMSYMLHMPKGSGKTTLKEIGLAALQTLVPFCQDIFYQDCISDSDDFGNTLEPTLEKRIQTAMTKMLETSGGAYTQSPLTVIEDETKAVKDELLAYYKELFRKGHFLYMIHDDYFFTLLVEMFMPGYFDTNVNVDKAVLTRKGHGDNELDFTIAKGYALQTRAKPVPIGRFLTTFVGVCDYVGNHRFNGSITIPIPKQELEKNGWCKHVTELEYPHVTLYMLYSEDFDDKKASFFESRVKSAYSRLTVYVNATESMVSGPAGAIRAVECYVDATINYAILKEAFRLGFLSPVTKYHMTMGLTTDGTPCDCGLGFPFKLETATAKIGVLDLPNPFSEATSDWIKELSTARRLDFVCDYTFEDGREMRIDIGDDVGKMINVKSDKGMMNFLEAASEWSTPEVRLYLWIAEEEYRGVCKSLYTSILGRMWSYFERLPEWKVGDLKMHVYMKETRREDHVKFFLRTMASCVERAGIELKWTLHISVD